MSSRKAKWRKAFEKKNENRDENKSEGASGNQEETLEKAKEMTTDSKTGGASSDNQQTTKNVQGDSSVGKREKERGRGRGRGKQKEKCQVTQENSRAISPGVNVDKPRQAKKDRGRVTLKDTKNNQEIQPIGRGNYSGPSHVQRPGGLNAVTRNQNSNTQYQTRSASPTKSKTLDVKALKQKDTMEVVHRLNKGMAQLKYLLRSQEEQHNSADFIFDLTCTLAVACKASSGENTYKILAALKGSAYLNSKIPSLLQRLQLPVIPKDKIPTQSLFECLIVVFERCLKHLPSSYADLPYAQLKMALDHSTVEKKEQLQNKLVDLKKTRDEIIRSERQKYASRCINKTGDKPPNDFREIPVCPTSDEIVTQKQAFLRKNITKGRYENAVHYLDVQFRLLREDFLEPLREGIPEIVQNVPRNQRKQMMKSYLRVRVVDKTFTWSGIIYKVKIDVSRLDTSRWPYSKRLIYGSFLCLSLDNFKTMLFATVADRDDEDLKRGMIKVRFIEGQDILGIESRDCMYQMVESPAYFEAYRHVLRGLQKLGEDTLPFKKYLVECSGEVDPPEYLRRADSEPPVCYDLSKALGIDEVANATAVPVLQPEAWPAVNDISLNRSQLEALRTAITTEFSVIQGPPGTGKTYVGTKIVRCLLENRKAWDPERNSPMLMVCYTNHALDQFLEKVLEFVPSRSIIRVGGRSKSQKLEECNLKKFTRRYRLHDKRDEVKESMTENDKERRTCKEHLAKGQNELLMFNDLENLMDPAHVEQFCKAKFPRNVANESRKAENTFKLWLCDNELVSSCNKTFLGKEEPKVNGGLTNESEHAEVTKSKSLKDVGKGNAVNQPHGTGCNPFASLDTSLELNEDFLQHHEFKSPLDCISSEASSFQPRNESNVHPPSNESEDSLHKEKNSAVFKDVEMLYVAGNMKSAEGLQTEELNNVDEETIAVEREADLIQNQRCIYGEENLLMEVSQREDESLQHDKQQAATGEDDFVFEIESNGKRRNPCSWLETKDNGSQEAKDDNMGNTKSRKKKKNKKNKKKMIITGNIDNLKEELKQQKMITAAEVMRIDNIWYLSQADRLRLYLFWIESYCEHYRVEIHRGEQEYKQLCEELEAITFEEEEQVIRQATVVGMTTTTAARYHSVLQRVSPKIVIIEEAAEVMEAHIVTSLSQQTKHTILIGDHKQLRPKPTVYELAQKFNLGVSLFERMVLNNMDCKRLSIQHRMRPEIAALTKRIYDHEIGDHGAVCSFDDISGICHNLFFIQHNQPEHMVGGLQSYANEHEAKFVVALCQYLLNQGYQKEQITVLTMYTGQLLDLQKRMPRRIFMGVKVCTVDNFQGEENDIILLSLVRSNSEGSIGFLGESNRICVALSRARKGFYCIGNFSLLKTQSKLWKEICSDLEDRGGIANGLKLVCKTHNNETVVRKDTDFNPLGGCNMRCALRLLCGHACVKRCHLSSHRTSECRKPCPNKCPNEHPCTDSCHYPRECPPCLYTVYKKVPKCGHEQSVPCSVDPITFQCKMKCEKLLPCGHDCPRECGQECTSQCKVRYQKLLPCGHEKFLPCYKDPMVYNQCTKKCQKVLECGHRCSKECSDTCLCDTSVEIDLPCKHTKRVLCRQKDYPIQCRERCQRKFQCGHNCPGMCFEDCTMKQCKTEVLKDLPCGHQQRVPCFQDPKEAFCIAPCLRRLDCAHQCTSLCGQMCSDVPCEQLCQNECQRGHACKKSCHFGLHCGDCMIEIEMTIPGCEHTITQPCYVDPATIRCKERCRRTRICGHPCKDICSNNCEDRPCEELVTRTLSCNHVVSLSCHKNHEALICEETVEVHLPCKHTMSVKCHVAKGGLENVACKMQVVKEFPCKHKLTLPCFKRLQDCICNEIVNVELPCGHMKSLPCSIVMAGLPDVECTVRVPRTLPCGHETTLPCHRKPEQQFCDQKVEVSLSCGHKKWTSCSSEQDELRSGICDQKVVRKLTCGHENVVQCSFNPDEVTCGARCERFLPCGHQCLKRCGDDCTSFQCAMEVEKYLSCGFHKLSCPCSDDVSELICSKPCKQRLKCGHVCPGRCSEDCQKYACQVKVVKRLNCPGNHMKEMACCEDPEGEVCHEQCKRILQCGHPCPGLCSQPCESRWCRWRVQKTYPCGHKKEVQCFQLNTTSCTARCRRQKTTCKHICKGVCGKPCSNYPCNVAVIKKLVCGHRIKMPCSSPLDTIQCPCPCNAKLACGHQCPGNCHDCSVKGFHEMCPLPCNRILVCSHRCQDVCGIPCPPCGKKSNRRCPHGTFSKLCSQSFSPCKKPCKWSCPHYQCNNLCGEECDRPRCDAPCPKRLSCGHPCIGLCGENCPVVCSICQSKKFSSVSSYGSVSLTGDTKYLQLFDCGHIVTVQKMDKWMHQQLGDDVKLIRCPKCSTAITFSYRYGTLVKRQLRKMEDVKTEICNLGEEVAKIAENNLLQLRHCPSSIQTMFQRLLWTRSLKRVDIIDIPLVFILNNHFIILNLLEKAQHTLRNTISPGSSNALQEIKQVSDRVISILQNIVRYLETPQPDLRTLNQVYGHARKFSLFASLLETQSEAIRRNVSFSSTAEMRLKKANDEFNLLCQGQNKALEISWLEKIVTLLRADIGLTSLPGDEPSEFENFPGFQKGVWKLCEHQEVYFTRLIVRDGEGLNVISKRCTQCVANESSD
ncbi:NFX1-type zinc finger-containing protein 1-like isoform X2 [Montipora foliosa]|uniref:NFX1-type zinc finger-containing protein 1-like isoform X2 n=1 Tax=Montipora foliosa TaxID=591990 RepID=UPI0035F162E0